MAKSEKQLLEDAVWLKLTVDEARDYSDETASKVTDAIDEAQGPVFADDTDKQWLIIEISK